MGDLVYMQDFTGRRRARAVPPNGSNGSAPVGEQYRRKRGRVSLRLSIADVALVCTCSVSCQQWIPIGTEYWAGWSEVPGGRRAMQAISVSCWGEGRFGRGEP